VKSISQRAFRNCVSLARVTFESGSKLSSIEYYAFAGCSSLSSISIPASITRIVWVCFDGCVSLSAVTFESPSSLSYFQNYPFARCPALKAISLPASLATLLGAYEPILKITGPELSRAESGKMEILASGASTDILLSQSPQVNN
jgi:hypothetical protein